MSEGVLGGGAAAAARVEFYDATYGRFDDPVYHAIRRETWGEDIGQNGWITAPEQDRFIEWLSLGPGSRLLDVACGSGGPALRIAERTRTGVIGIDIHADGIASASRLASQRQLADLASFAVMDACGPLGFDDSTFDAVICIDAINHLPDRSRVLREWARVLKPGGRLLFTDPVVVTGPLTSQDIAIRSSIGFFLLVAPETNERLLRDVGFDVRVKEDATEALARSAAAWHAARERRAAELRRVEGVATFEGQQRFLEVAARIARERSLSRFAYLAAKPG